MIETIEQGKIHIQQGMSDGVSCPCCGQLVKLYRRTLYHSMAVALCSLYREAQGRTDVYVHIDQLTLNVGGSDFSKLKHWGLIEAYPQELHDDPKTKTAGKWRITDKGCEFAEGRITLPKYALIFNNRCYGMAGDPVTIIDSLKEDFDYPEMMGYLV